jgi:carbon storage regulator CsrA
MKAQQALILYSCGRLASGGVVKSSSKPFAGFHSEWKWIPMLKFGRKAGEGFVINGNIKVTIEEIKGKKIRVSIDAPSDVPVFRTEIQERRDAGVLPKSEPVRTWKERQK